MWGVFALVIVGALVAYVELGSAGTTEGATWALVKNAAPPITGTSTQVDWNSAFPNVLQRQKDQGKPVVLLFVSKGQPTTTRTAVWGLVTSVDDPSAATKGTVQVTYQLPNAPQPVSWAPPEGTVVAVQVQDLYGVEG